jgi:hypothetical protein
VAEGTRLLARHGKPVLVGEFGRPDEITVEAAGNDWVNVSAYEFDGVETAPPARAAEMGTGTAAANSTPPPSQSPITRIQPARAAVAAAGLPIKQAGVASSAHPAENPPGLGMLEYR